MTARSLFAAGAVALAAACAQDPDPDPDPDAPLPVVTASPEVMAGRLARLLWDQEPDATLTGQLGTGTLDAGTIAVLAERMLADPRADAGIGAFFHWWLFLEPLETLGKVDPEGVLDPALRSAMAREAPAVGAYVTREMRGTFNDLLTAPFTFVDERLARHYGLAGVTGPQLRRVTYPPGQHRIGILTGAGLLTLFSSLASPSWPAKRGWLINDPLLCTLPVRTLMPTQTPDPARSIRQQMIEVTKDAGCMGCHKFLNSPGFAFIGFDGFGRWRPEAGHGPNETVGWIPPDLLADEPSFNGPEELARLLAARELPRRCLTRRWLEFAVDPAPNAILDGSEPFERSVESTYAVFARSGYELRALVLGIVRSEVFLGATGAAPSSR